MLVIVKMFSLIFLLAMKIHFANGCNHPEVCVSFSKYGCGNRVKSCRSDYAQVETCAGWFTFMPTSNGTCVRDETSQKMFCPSATTCQMTPIEIYRNDRSCDCDLHQDDGSCEAEKCIIWISAATTNSIHLWSMFGECLIMVMLFLMLNGIF